MLLNNRKRKSEERPGSRVTSFDPRSVGDRSQKSDNEIRKFSTELKKVSEIPVEGKILRKITLFFILLCIISKGNYGFKMICVLST